MLANAVEFAYDQVIIVARGQAWKTLPRPWTAAAGAWTGEAK